MGRFLIAVFGALSLAGCATLDPLPQETVQWTFHHDGSGGQVRVLEMAGQDCPRAMSGGALAGGCSTLVPAYVIFYPAGDANARRHELEHVAGMRHGPWMPAHVQGMPCTVVTAGGLNTAWKPGDLMCRARDGSYFRGGENADTRLIQATAD